MEITNIKIFKIKQRGALLGYANIIFNLILYVKFNIITYSSIKSFSTYNTNKFNIWSFFDYENAEYMGDCYVLCTVAEMGRFVWPLQSP